MIEGCDRAVGCIDYVGEVADSKPHGEENKIFDRLRWAGLMGRIFWPTKMGRFGQSWASLNFELDLAKAVQPVPNKN